MKILLIYPEFPVTYWSFKHALAIEGKRAAFPPLGLLTVAAMLPENWEKRLVDLNIEDFDEAELEWADIVFLSAMIVQKDSLRKLIEKCRRNGKRVVVGGPFVSTSHDDLGADHIFIGEAEKTLPEFIEDLKNGTPKAVYSAADKPDLTDSPVPDFSLAKLEHYSAMSVQYSRGCPFSCEFCDIIEIYGRVPRTKSNGQIVAELAELKRIGWEGMVFIVDDNFIGNKKNVRKLLPDLIEWSEQNRFPFSYITEASVNLAEDEVLLDQMRAARFRRVFLGIETPAAESLKEAKKGQNTHRDLLDSVRRIQSYGMEVMAGFIVGFDSDPKDIFKRQIEFIRESGIPLAMVGLLNALPDTQLWRRLKKEGRLLQESSGDNTDCAINFVPKMDKARLIEGYREILSTIYSSREFYRRSLDCLSRIGNEMAEKKFGGLSTKLAAFTRLVLKLGVIDRERMEFWRYFRRVLARHRQSFAHAMVLAAMGYHFRQLTESAIAGPTEV